MSAHLLVDLDIHDQDGFQAYGSRVPEFVAKHGGEHLVRGVELLWKPCCVPGPGCISCGALFAFMAAS